MRIQSDQKYPLTGLKGRFCIHINELAPILMRHLFTIIAILTLKIGFSQNDSLPHRHSGAMQFGGQTIVSFHYEYSIIARKHLLLNTNIGIGLNEHADDSDPSDRPVYGIHSGLIFLVGTNPIYLEIGFSPTTYFYKSTSFINLNGWSGLRLTPKKLQGFFISAGFTPRLYTSYTDPNNHYNNTPIGLKAGVTF